MTAWQRTAIAIARSRMAKTLAQPVIGRTLLARRFIAYGTVNDAVWAARALDSGAGITASLFYLGEYIDDPHGGRDGQLDRRAASLLGVAGLDVHVSIDPTAIGYLTSESLAAATPNASHTRSPATRAVIAGSCSTWKTFRCWSPTLALLHHLLAQDLPAAITLQARLRRTARRPGTAA